MTSEITEIVYAFGPQPKAFMAVGILLQYFRKTEPNLGMSRFISLTKLSSAAFFKRTSHYSNLNFTYEEDYNVQLFHNTDIAAFRPNK